MNREGNESSQILLSEPSFKINRKGNWESEGRHAENPGRRLPEGRVAFSICPTMVINGYFVISDLHVQRRRDAREDVDQQRDQRPVAQAYDGRNVDAVKQLLRLVAVE